MTTATTTGRLQHAARWSRYRRISAPDALVSTHPQSGPRVGLSASQLLKPFLVDLVNHPTIRPACGTLFFFTSPTSRRLIHLEQIPESYRAHCRMVVGRWMATFKEEELRFVDETRKKRKKERRKRLVEDAAKTRNARGNFAIPGSTRARWPIRMQRTGLEWRWGEKLNDKRKAWMPPMSTSFH